MFLMVQPDFVERAVFEAVRSDAALSRVYHREFARCYGEPDDVRRDLAFREMHERWFEQLGLRKRVFAIIDEFQHVSRNVSRLVMTPASGRGGRSAELFGAPGRYSVVLTMAVATLLDESAFSYWARHELMHVDDMLDPSFCYDSTARTDGPSPTARSVVRDRYALLWAMSIDARLLLFGKATNAVVDRRRDEFGRAFGIQESTVLDGLFNRLWAQLRQERPTNPELLSWASGDLPGLAVTECETTHAPVPGSACPICKFSTFDWADTEEQIFVSELLADDFPDWRPIEGMCRRCDEIYRSCLPPSGWSAHTPAGNVA